MKKEVLSLAKRAPTAPEGHGYLSHRSVHRVPRTKVAHLRNEAGTHLDILFQRPERIRMTFQKTRHRVVRCERSTASAVRCLTLRKIYVSEISFGTTATTAVNLQCVLTFRVTIVEQLQVMRHSSDGVDSSNIAHETNSFV